MIVLRHLPGLQLRGHGLDPGRARKDREVPPVQRPPAAEDGHGIEGMGAGMTVREHSLELIHAEIDGELTGPQRAELNRLLLADPALRALRDELRRTCARDRRAPGRGTARRVCTNRSWQSLPARSPRRAWRHPSSGRPAVCAMPPHSPAGCSSARWRSSSGRGRTPCSSDRARRHDRRRHRRPVPARAAPRRRCQGTVRLEGTAAAPVVVAELVAEPPVQVIARLDGQEVRLTALLRRNEDRSC